MTKKTKPKRTRTEYGREYTDKMREHLDAVRTVKRGKGNSFNPDGRPTKEDEIKAYQKANPEATKYRCSKDLNIDYKTVQKWWK